MTYKVGEKVRIRKGLDCKGYEVTHTMKLDEGKTAEIIKKDFDIFNQEYSYQLKIDGKESVFNWYEYMCEPLENKIRGYEEI